MRPNRVLAIVLALIVAGSVAAVPGAAAAASQDDGLNQTENDTGTNVTEDEAEPGVLQNETEANATNQTQNETQVGVAGNDTGNETVANDTSMRQPGITEDGELNVTELYAAHQQILEAEGYQATENTTVRLNGSVAFTADVAYAASAGGNTTSMDANISVAGKNSSVSVWSNESITYVRTVEDGNVSYAAFERGPPEFAGPETDQNETDETGQNETGQNETDENETGLNETGVAGTNETNETGPNETGETADAQTDDSMQMRGGMGGHGMHGMYSTGGEEMQKPGHALLALEGNVGEATIENETEGDNFTRQTVTAPLQFEDYRGNATGNLTLVVDERGVVHSANASASSDLYAADSTYDLSVDELGVEELDQPAWIDEVPENATEGPPQEQPGEGPDAESDAGQAPGQDEGAEPGPAGGPDAGPENETGEPGGGPGAPGDGGPENGGANETAGGGPDGGADGGADEPGAGPE